MGFVKLTSGAIYCMSGEGKRRDMRVAVRAPVSQVSVTLAGAGQLAAHAHTHTHNICKSEFSAKSRKTN